MKPADPLSKNPIGSWRRRAFAVAAIGVGAVAATTIAAIVALQLGPVRSALKTMITESIPGLSIAEIETGLPGTIDLHQIVYADDVGRIASADRVAVSWAPFRLLYGQLHIVSIDIERPILHRIPDSEVEAGTNPDSSNSNGLPVLPISVSVERIRVDHLKIEEAVAGESIEIDIRSDLAAEVTGDAKLAFAIERTNAPGTSLEGVVNFTAADRNIDVDVEGSEPAGGALARLLDLPGQPAAAIRLKGNGPIHDWKGDLSAGFEDAANVEAAMALAITERLDLNVAGTVNAGGLMPAPLQRLVNGEMQFSAVLQSDDDGANADLSIEIDADSFTLALTARSPDLGETIDARLAATLSDAGALNPLIPGLGTDGLKLTIGVTGPLASASVVVDASTAEITLPDLSVHGLAVHVAGRSSDWFAVTEGEAAKLNGTLSSNRMSGAAVDPVAELVGQPINVSFSAMHSLTGELLLLSDVDIDLPWGQVSGEALLDRMTGALSGELTAAIPSVAFTQTLTGFAADGRAWIDTDFELADDISLSGASIRLEDVRTEIDALDLILAGVVQIDTALTLRQSGEIELYRTSLSSASMTLDGSATLGDRVDGEVLIRVPDLAQFNGIGDETLAGALAANVVLGGELRDPSASTSVRGWDLIVSGFRFPSLSLTGQARNLASGATGQLAADLDGPAGPAALGVTFSLPDYEVARLSDFYARAAEIDVRGGLEVDLETMLASGALRIASEDLRPTGGLLGLNMAGRIDADIALEASSGRQEIKANIAGRSLAVDDISVAQLNVAARGALEKGGVALDANADVRQAAVAGVALSSIKLKASGPAERIAVDLSAEGSIAKPFWLASKMTVAQGADAIVVTVADLNGTLADTPVRLFGNARATIAERRVEAEADLGFADGRLALTGILDGPTISARLSADAMPVALANLFIDEPALEGSIDVQADIDLSPASDIADLRITGEGLRLLHISGADIPPIATTADVRLRDGRASIDAILTGPTRRPASIRFSLPMAREGGSVPLPASNGSIDGFIEWEGNLNEIEPMLNLAEHEFSGNMDVSVNIAGTLDQPHVTGMATIADGRYVNLTTGTLVTDLAANIRGADDGSLSIEADARDGGTGRLTASGRIAPTDTSIELEAQFAEFRALRRDDAEADVTGGLSVDVSGSGGRIEGNFEVSPVEIRLLDALPASVAILDVVEETGDAQPRDETPLADAGIALDIIVKIPGRAFVRGRGVDSEWGGEIAVTGNTDNPVITGRVEVIRGEVSALGTTFNIERGIVDLDGAAMPDPILDVNATTQAGNLKVSLNIAGRASEPSIELDSRPPQPRDEIFARLLFGKSSGSLGPGEALTLANAIQTLRSGDAGVMDRLRDSAGLDVLRASSGESGPGVTAGKYVTDSVYVGINQGVGPGETSATVEVEVTDTISVETETGADADSSIGVNWKFDY